MTKLFSFIKDYKKIELSIKNAIAAEFFIQAVNATFTTILPLYMHKENFSNNEIALYIAFRYLGVFLLAFPLGNYIKGKKVLPLFFISSFCVPLFGILIVLAIFFKLKFMIYPMLFLWGASFTLIQIPIFPYILRNAEKQHHTAAIALSYTTWSFAGILTGLVTAILDFINPNLFDEKFILLLFSFAGFGGLYYLRRIKNFNEVYTDLKTESYTTPKIKSDWKLIFRALIPTLIIATGAGLTIPFISLFFQDVHHLNKGSFSALSFMASLLVAYFALLVPVIKQKIGYKIAIPTTQSLAVISLVALATTQFYSQYSIALLIASVCFILRQPLMNLAGPMTSELVLYYVGKKNREITSALTSAIWSGSWALSAVLVSILFTFNFSFVNIFLMTSLLYTFGIVLYYLLILDYNKREEKGLIEE